MYDVIQKVGENTTVVSSWGADKKAQAKSAYFEIVHLLYADEPTASGVVVLVDDKFDVVDGCKEFIVKD